MRSFALCTLVSALGLAACNNEENLIASATEGTAGTTGPAVTTGAMTDTATSTTTGEPDPTTGTVPTTGEPDPTTTGTTGEPGTTGTTEEPGTSTLGETTGDDPAIPQGAPYGSCNNDMGNQVMCQGQGVLCLDDNNVQQLDGSFCSPSCATDECPEPNDLPPGVQALCAFDSNNDNMPDICALLCVYDPMVMEDPCPAGSTCDDVGIPQEMNNMVGICTWPKG